MTVSKKTFGAGAVVVAAILFGGGVPGERSSGVARAAPPALAGTDSAPGIQVAQAAAAASPAPTTVTAAGITLRSVSFDFPGSDHMFPGGAAADPVNANCIACHSAGMVLTQPKLSAAVWQEEVNKMRLTYKAPIAEADVPAIVAYLASLKIAD